MNTEDPLDQLYTDWRLPNWQEIIAAVRNQIWLLLLINAIYSGGILIMRWTGHPILLFIPQMLLGLLLTLTYYRMIINPEGTISIALPKAVALLPFAIWVGLLKMMAVTPGILLLVLPGLYVAARLILAEALVAADRPGISDHPLKASWKLTESHKGFFCAAQVLIIAWTVLVVFATRRFGTVLQPSVILFRALLGLPVSVGWMGFTAICAARAIDAQPEELSANLSAAARPGGWDVWFTRLFAGFGLIIAFVVFMMGIGYFLGTSPAGSKMTRVLSRLNSTGGNVIIHGKTILVPPSPWIATPEQNFLGSQAVSFRLTAIGIHRGAPQIRIAWLPLNSPPVLDQAIAQRLSNLVIRGMDTLELQPSKMFRKLYDLQQRQLAEYHVDGLSIVQNPDPHGWIVMRSRGNPPSAFKRDRFMPWDGGLLVFSDTRYSFQDGIEAEKQMRPLIEALKLR